MKKLLFSSVVMASIFSLPSIQAAESTFPISDTDIASYPLYAETANKPPLIMLMLGRDHSMYYEAYNDLTDLDEDGKIDNTFVPHVVYDGIFESNWCYTYGDGNKFKMTIPADIKGSTAKPIYVCDGNTWSGNFLNYLTSTRMDIVKRILIGGQRYSNMDVCATNNTDINGTYKTCYSKTSTKKIPIITRQFVPRDTHAWAKVFNRDDMEAKFGSDYSLNKFVPTSVVGEGHSAMFGTAGRNLLVLDDSVGPKIGSYIKLNTDPSYNANSVIFPWDWVARESGSQSHNNLQYYGDCKNFNGYGVVSISNDCTGVNVPGLKETNYVLPVKEFFLSVEACNIDTINNKKMPLPQRCKAYSDTHYNTVGLLQDFSKFSGSDAYFGLITANWINDTTKADAQKYAALRSEIVDLSKEDQIDKETGEFKDQSLMALISELSLSSVVNSPKSSQQGNTGNNWSDCKLDGNNNKTTPQRGCSDWGNPLLPMLKLSYDYFSNQQGDAIADSFGLKMRRYLNDDVNITYTYPSLGNKASPYKRENTNSKARFDYCYRPVNFILTDESISMDYNSSHLTNVDSAINTGFKTILAGEKNYFKGSKIFGELSGSKKMKDGETLHTLKTVGDADLPNVRGVSTLEPNLQGSLKGAAYATYLHSQDARIDIGATEKVAPFEHFAVAMASYLPQFEIYTYNGKKVLFVPFCKAPRRTLEGTADNGENKIGSFNFDKEEGYTSNCAVADVFFVNSQSAFINGEERLTGVEIRVTYEDNEAGSDFDQDALFTYKIESDANNKDLIDVSITGFYSDTYAGQLGAYNIFGVEGTITPNYSNCNDSYCTIKSLGTTDEDRYKIDTRSYYIDVMKVEQNAKNQNFSLMFSNSDPYNEYNYIDPSSISANISDSNKVGVLLSGDKCERGDNHRYYFLKETQEKGIKGYVYKDTGNYIKFLPNFTQTCQLTVSRKFYVKDGLSDEASFYDSPLDYAAYYGSQYGEYGNYKSRKANNPNYFYVSNASKLSSQIAEALTKAVNAGTNSGTGVAFPSLDLSEDQSFVTATFDTTYWTSILHSNNYIRTSSNMTTAKADSDIAKFDDHKIWIADKEGKLLELTAENLNQTKHPLYNSIFRELGLTDCQDNLEHENAIISHYIKYLNGDSSWEYKGNEKSTTEDNSALTAYYTCNQTPFYGFHARRAVSEIGTNNDYKLGAVINSTPQFFGDRRIIFAANDGMVHMGYVTKGSTEVHITSSIIPYVSQENMPRYAKRRNNDFYLNDGLITLSDVYVGGVKKTIAIGTLGVAHSGMYAMDLTGFTDRITNPDNVMMWELSPYYYRTATTEKVRNLANLGAINSKINVYPYNRASDEDPRTYLYAVFGNGYNSRDGVSGVAVVNALTGNVLTKNAETGDLIIDKDWSTPDCMRSEDSYNNFIVESTSGVKYCYKNGMNQITANDQNHDNVLDYIYSTDIYGNVFRINTYNSFTNKGSKLEPKDWVLTHIHTTVDPNGNVQSITSAPQLSKDSRGYPMVMFASGKYLGKSDLYTTDVQSIWAISDQLYSQETDTELIASGTDMLAYRGNDTARLYKFAMLAKNDLSDCKLDYGANFELNAGMRCRSNAQDLPSTDAPTIYDAQFYKGWLLDLYEKNSRNGASERVYRNMIVLDRHLFVTSMVPSDSECKGGGTSNFFDLNIWSADFYNNPNDSQTYSDSIYSEMTLAYDKRTPQEVSGSDSQGQSGRDKSDNTGPTNRNEDTTGCTQVLVGRGDSDGGAAIDPGNLYCPHVKSWQRIYH